LKTELKDTRVYRPVNLQLYRGRKQGFYRYIFSPNSPEGKKSEGPATKLRGQPAILDENPLADVIGLRAEEKAAIRRVSARSLSGSSNGDSRYTMALTARGIRAEIALRPGQNGAASG
jgi:hypothetical protein